MAGIVALILDKKGKLNITEVRDHLKFGGQPGPGLTGTAHDRAFGAGLVDAKRSHSKP